jgi:3-hydroxy-9,10-secoandrosta-1,3,5(10)-triene-9,17-dione monooxygenase
MSDVTDDLITTAEKLIPLLSEHAAETEAIGRPAAPVVRAVREAGFLNLFGPAALGGHQADLATAVDVFERLGRGCGSTAWVAMLAAGGSYLAALLGDEARADVWGDDPHAMVCGGFGPTGTAQPVAGGFTVSGRWQPLSGVQDAQWAVVAVPVHGMMLLPVAAGEIEQTWQVAGMRGTGSHTLTVREAFVPAHRVLSMPRMLTGDYAADHPGEPLYQAMPIPLLSVAMLGPVLGMAQAALTVTLDRLARGKAIGGTVYRDATDSPAVRFGVADAASRIDTARLHTDRAVRDVAEAHRRGELLTVAGRARIRMDTAATVTAVRGAIQLLLDVNGASGFAADQPLQRIWRDLEVATRHQLVASDVSREVYGRALLGIDEQVTPLF